MSRTKGDGLCPICRERAVDRKYGGYCKECNALVCNIKVKLRQTNEALTKVRLYHRKESIILWYVQQYPDSKPSDLARTINIALGDSHWCWRV